MANPKKKKYNDFNEYYDAFLQGKENNNDKQFNDYYNAFLQGNTKTNSQPKKKKDKFFDSGALSDGYQFGDIGRTILGTGADVVTSAGKGVWDVGQGTAKLIVGGIAEAADLFGKDEYADMLRDRLAGKDEKVNKRLENIDVFGRANKVADKSSVLGEKTDRVFESVGQIGAYTAPVIGQASMFTSSAGSNLAEAYSKDATDAQAWTKGLIGGGISVVTEKLFGLFGESGLDTAVANKISSKLTSGIAKTLARQGVQATAEGIEEVIEYTGDQLLDWAIDKVSNGKGAKLKEDWNWEEVGESFANAFISSAIVGAGQTALGVKQSGGIDEYARQVDSANGILTENEQKVLDNVIEQRIEEATQNQDLSKKEIKAIETQAKQDLQSGNISVETIENTLGLKNYINDVITDVESKMGRQITQQEANEISQLTRNRFLENLQNDRLLQNSYVNEQNKANANRQENSLEQQLEKQGERVLEEAESKKEGMINNFKEYLEEHNITNPTQEDINNSITDIMGYDNEQTLGENIRDEKLYNQYVREYMQENNIPFKSEIQGLDYYTKEDVKDLVNSYIEEKLQENGIDPNEVKIVNSDLHGSRLRGDAKANSDLDVVVQYDGDIREDDLFNILNDNGDENLNIDGINVDINPIKENLADYMKRSNEYDNELKRKNNVEEPKQIKEKVPTTKEIADKVEKKITKQVNDAIAPLKDSIDEINKSIDKVMDNIAPMVEQANSTLEERIAKNKEIIDKIDYDKLYDKLPAKDILMDQANRYAALNYGEEYIPPQINIDEQGNKQVIPKEKSAFRQAKDTFKRLFTNSNVEIDNLAEESGNKNIKYAGDMLNSVMGEAQGDISVAQTNNNGEAIGKSLNEIFSEANNSGLSEAFNDYLIQQSNIDRHEQGKGSIVPSADSELLVREYEKTYPQFKEWAKDVWKYGANTRANLVDAGIISQELSDKLANMYPHYVPFISDSNNINNIINDTGEIIPKNTIKRAKGGANIGQVLPVQEALERYTYSQKKAVRQNQLYQQIVGTLSDGLIELGADTRDFTNDYTSMSESLYKDENGNYLTAYVDGERKSVRISEDLYNSLNNDLQNRVKDFENKFRFVTKPLQKISEVRRNLLTTWNPSFALTNPIKDIQDASLNSKYPTAMAKNVPRAVNELFRNDTDRVRQFRTLYGAVNAFGEFENNTLNQKAKNNKFVRNLINFNENMELAPRYAEFLASIENGASIQEAMYNAREVTTNFSRGGVIAKALNRNGFTFLNANIQGLSKFYRNIKGENGIRGTVGALTRAAVLGIAPAVFNEIAFGAGDDKDEEYEALPDYVKDNYYIIKTSDGNFIRIPKGRMLSIFGSAARRTIEAVEGEENAFEGYLKNAYDQVGVANPLNNNVFAPLIQAFGSENGTNWYGGDLVPTRLQDVPKGEQTDATIDAFSTWLGEKLNVSPYKINYVLDQYSGGIGDIFLPMMTQEATNDTTSLTGQLLAPIKDKFTVNATDDNKYVSDFYSKSEELQVKANSKNATDEDMLREKYMYSISKGMSELYKERREVQADDSLTKEEKYAKSQAIKDEINRLAKVGLDGYNNIEGYGNYMVVGDDIGYYKNAKGEWKPINEDDITFIESQGLTDREKSDYFSTKNDIGLIVEDYKDKLDGVDDADTKNQLYASKKKEIAQEIQQMDVPDETKAYMFDKYYSSADKLSVITDSGIDFNTYLDFASQTFTADKNKQGKTISGSKKQKVYNYINSMDNLNYGEKCILAKLEYKSDNRYNNQIIQYLNNSNLDYDTEASILKELGFKVSDDGRITW